MNDGKTNMQCSYFITKNAQLSRGEQATILELKALWDPPISISSPNTPNQEINI